LVRQDVAISSGGIAPGGRQLRGISSLDVAEGIMSQRACVKRDALPRIDQRTILSFLCGGSNQAAASL
jgi:hypothetical protein